jgi:glucan phosphoethanolaminetransferase (alkaline phosphatase superfamily)
MQHEGTTHRHGGPAPHAAGVARAHGARVLAGVRCFSAGFAFAPLVAYLAWVRPDGHRLSDALVGLVFTLALVALPAVLRWRGWAAGLFYLALGLVTTASLVNLALTMELPSLGAATVALRTHWGEASSLLVAARGATVAISLAALLWLAGCISFVRRPPRLPAAFASVPARALLAAPLLLVFAAPDAAATYPMSLATIAARLHEYGADTRGSRRLLVDPFAVQRSTRADEVVVLVIGESSGAKNWQLDGYARPTTPNMMRRLQAGEIVNFRAHMATAGMTSFAVPTLLSPFAEMSGIGSPPHRRSVVTLMSRAGFRTAWYGANEPQPAATEADEIIRAYDDSMLEVDTRYDDWLPRQLGQWLDRVPHGSTFVVLHTWGSHTPFEGRYPPEAAVWNDGYAQKAYPQSQTVDNYDNSIRYSDTVLEAAVSRLESDRRPALLVFVADHAEPWLQRSFWRYQAPRDVNLLHVPFFIWGNAAWRRDHAAEWEKLQAFARSGEATTHLDIVPTLAGALGIGYEGKPRQRDLLAPEFLPWAGATPALAPDDRAIVQAVAPKVPRLGSP